MDSRSKGACQLRNWRSTIAMLIICSVAILFVLILYLEPGLGSLMRFLYILCFGRLSWVFF